MFKKCGFLVLIALMAAGCTRSIDATYNAGIRDGNENVLTSTKVAVLPFSDQRAWVDSGDDKSKSFVGKQGVWRFGLTFNEQPYTSVSSIVQSVLVSELKTVGVSAVASSNAQKDVNYNLSGRIINFEFENETGFVTVTSRRTVTLALTLTDKDGRSVLNDQLFSEIDREGEGMGVMHSTNVDKLMNRVLKKVVSNVVSQIRTKLSMGHEIDLRITLNGRRINLEKQAYSAELALNSR